MKLILDVTYNFDGMDKCVSVYDGEMVTFNNDAEAVALFNLLKSGNHYFYIKDNIIRQT